MASRTARARPASEPPTGAASAAGPDREPTADATRGDGPTTDGDASARAPERPAERIREALEQSILLGEIAVGARLDESRLAERFAVSRTPVREALQLLVASGLLEHRRHRGVFVRAPDARELAEMFEVMAELEGLCGRLLARRADPTDVDRLRRLVDDCERALASGDSDHYYRENERLHLALYELSGNRFLAAEAGALHRRLQPFRRLQLRVPERLRQSMREHRAIVDAIAAADADAAARELRAHVAVQGERFADLLVATERERERRAAATVDGVAGSV